MKDGPPGDLHPLVKKIAEFARSRHLESDAATTASDRFCRSEWAELCSSGLLGIAMPKAYGGSGESLLVVAQSVRALSRYCTNEGLIFSLCAHLTTCMVPLMRFGTDAQKEKYLPSLITGDLIGGNGTTEGMAGSDLSNMQTTVSCSGDSFLLNGKKTYVTNGSVADLLIIFGTASEGMSFANISALIVECGTSGVTVEKDWDKMGLNSSPLSQISFVNCSVPVENLLGRARLGMEVFNESMLWERTIMSAYLIGSMELQFNLVLKWCRERKQFGKKISDFQGVSYRLVEMKRVIETSSALLHQVCWKHANGSLGAADASLLKLHVSEGRVANSIQAMSLLGAYGYSKETAVEAQLRNSMAAPIYSGTSDIQKIIISNAFEEYV